MSRFGIKRRPTGVLFAGVVLIAFGAMPLGLVQDAAAGSRVLKTFTALGRHKWTVPAGVSSIEFDVYGASGGNILGSSHGVVFVRASGGAGGEARGRFTVSPGEIFEIVVGAAGGSGGKGGFNGGGYAQSTSEEDAGGGGGASDVRIGGRGNPCASNLVCAYEDRIIVGGGGGGAAYGTAEGDGRPGGGVAGGTAGAPHSNGGGQEAAFGGDCPTLYVFGCFGDGGGYDVNRSAAQAGGGGGWYGGDASWEDRQNEGGSGGSGFISVLATSGSFPGGTHVGDGLVIIRT